MDDVVDSRGREAMLPDSSSVACSNVNMTSIDSGVETGNDSNDSSTVQQDVQQYPQDVSLVENIDFSGMKEEWKLVLPPFVNVYLPQPESSVSPKFRTMFAKKSMIQTSPEVFDMMWEKHKGICDLYRRKMLKERMRIRPWRKVSLPMGTTYTLALNDWIERMQRKMRLAATTNNITLMQRILNLAVSPNNHDEHGRTPLHISACRGYTEIVRLLLENGADPNQRDCIGNTPLHLATVNSKLSVVMLLLTAGTDVLALDSYGYNPLQLAKTKLRMLQRNCNNEDMLKVKEEMHNVINMLMAYLQKQKNMREQVETLSNFCSRLSLSNTSDQVQDDVKDLLASINALNITD